MPPVKINGPACIDPGMQHTQVGLRRNRSDLFISVYGNEIGLIHDYTGRNEVFYAQLKQTRDPPDV